MTPKERAVMQQALEALEESCYPRLSTKHTNRYEEAINALEEALAEQAEQEPVAWRNKGTGSFCTGGFLCKDIDKWTPLFAAPVRTKDLTDDEMEELCRKYARFELIREAIAADREKNK